MAKQTQTGQMSKVDKVSAKILQSAPFKQSPHIVDAFEDAFMLNTESEDEILAEQEVTMNSQRPSAPARAPLPVPPGRSPRIVDAFEDGLTSNTDPVDNLIAELELIMNSKHPSAPAKAPQLVPPRRSTHIVDAFEEAFTINTNPVDEVLAELGLMIKSGANAEKSSVPIPQQQRFEMGNSIVRTSAPAPKPFNFKDAFKQEDEVFVLPQRNSDLEESAPKPPPRKESLMKRSKSNLQEILSYDKRFKSFETWKEALKQEWDEAFARLDAKVAEIGELEQEPEKYQQALYQIYSEQPSLRPLLQQLEEKKAQGGQEYDCLLWELDKAFTALVEKNTELAKQWEPICVWGEQIPQVLEEVAILKKEYDSGWHALCKQRYHTSHYINQLEMYGRVEMAWLKESEHLHPDITKNSCVSLLATHTPLLEENRTSSCSKTNATTSTSIEKKSLRFADQIDEERALREVVYYKKGSGSMDLFVDAAMQESWESKVVKGKGEAKGILHK